MLFSEVLSAMTIKLVRCTHSMDNFSEELKVALDHFPKHHVKIHFRDFKSKFGRGSVFKLTVWNESLHQDSNDNGLE
jgi:hypothetical protein